MGNLEKLRHAAQTGALLVRGDELGTLTVRGKDRQTWLDGLVTCQLKGKRSGDGAYGLVVTKSGKVQAELWVVLGDDLMFVGVDAQRVAGVLETFDRHLIMEDAELADASGELAWLFAHGPLAPELAGVARGAGAHAAPVDRTGRGGLAVVAPRASLAAVEAALVAHAPDRVAAASADAWRALAVELFVPRFGVDFDDQVYPQEAALEEAGVSFSKGCYLGQEAVYMLQARGHVKRRLVQLRVDGLADLEPGAAVADEDGAVGQVTSATPAGDGSSTFALAYVKYKHARLGATLSVGGRAARVVVGLAASTS